MSNKIVDTWIRQYEPIELGAHRCRATRYTALAQIKQEMTALKELAFHPETETPYKALYNFLKAENERLEYNLSCLLDYATGGLLSKTNYTKEAMYGAVDDYIERRIEKALNPKESSE